MFAGAGRRYSVRLYPRAVLNIYDSLYKYSDKIQAPPMSRLPAMVGYSRTTGRTGVVIATSGPGAKSTIATAYMILSLWWLSQET